MLGAIGAASLAAHKFWPKGITYGDKDDWEVEHEKKEHGGGDKKGKGKEDKKGGERSERDEKKYLQERYRERPRLPRTMEGEEGRAFWERRERMPSRNRYPPPPEERRYIEAAPAPPPPRRHSMGPPGPRRIEAVPAPVLAPTPAPPPPPPAAPNPPRTHIEHAPLVVPAGANRRESEVSAGSRGRYYVDGDTIVVPSTAERAYVIQRDAPPGQRLRTRERDGDYYR